jgi:flagellar protein FliT
MQHNLLGYYHAIEESSRKMLAAAKDQDWDTMVRYEGACAVLIEQLKMQARTESLDEEKRREKTSIMLRILNNDAQIRTLVEPWLDDAGQHLGTQRVLH